ncbi:S8 family serine peptidase [Shewanella loihica]|uniref:Peptidase S8 and S53, subtilisin, kexin, sedolisin n=1 Tax=Shewanella loihica (strain ATCC BAA-1088 / PV-4) TaxID=323850 RepID=A3QBF8_SHELP|nr:S8 family serine peptidase [Shewanella loihica]ABO22806.1 peptidase S8 and S53, subtilisin, kexin, sedolisin [Shewanella loihica PV-4]
MKSSRRNLLLSALSVAIASACYANPGAASFSDDTKPLQTIIPGQEKLKLERADKQRSDGMYFVRFKEAPVASYDGSLAGFAATNIQVNQSNKQASGLLNSQSKASLQYRGYLKQQQAKIKQRLNGKLKRILTPTQEYQLIVNAMAVKLKPGEADIIAKDPEVLSVEPIGLHFIQTSTGPEFIGAKQVWQGDEIVEATKGEGVIVGVMDTGINANHPSFAEVGADGYQHKNPLGDGQYLGDCQQYSQFCNGKLIGIISYPELIQYRQDTADSLDDPAYEDLANKVKVGYDFNGHGSHVASTASGNILHDVNFYLQVQEEDGTIIAEKSAFEFDAISGVAPHANLVSYQVCDDAGSCYPEFTLKAIEHAIENGVQVLNYSVGGSAKDPWSSIDAEAFLNAREAGIHVAVAAGNAGPSASTIGSPGNAPWVTTVAAYTHDLEFKQKSLTNMNGGETPPADMMGFGVTKGVSGKVVLAASVNSDNAQCTDPFEAGSFDGEIVVCERGTNARVRKGINVKEGGAGGMILINMPDGVDSLHNDNHVLPAIQLNAADGERLTQWLASGEGHQATIEASETTRNASLGDIAGVFTSRGPNLPYPNIFSPDIAAPGVDIYAANAEDRLFEGQIGHIPFASLSGTSMATPHVTGAYALLKAAHPDWTPAQAQSAFMSTAHQTTYKDDDYDGTLERSDFFDQGAGSLRINQALKAGLLLDIDKAGYLAANPEMGGDPSALNTSSMVQNQCISNCSWTRTVTATQASSWSAEYEYLNPGFTLEVTPSSFSLNAGESQVLTIKATANINLVDEWVHGYIKLNNADTSMSDTHLQATIGFKAGQVAEEVSAEMNNVDNQLVIEDIFTSGSNALQVKGFGLYKAQSFTGSAIGSSNDAERGSPHSNPEVIFSVPTVVKPYTKRLVVEITDTTSPDMDLYVGIDENGDGMPDAYEMYYSLLCLSGEVDSKERCILENPPTGNYWIFAHNYEGRVEDEADEVTLEITHVNYSNQASFDITAPSQVAQDERFDVSLSVNGYLDDSLSLQPLEAGETYYGLLEMGTTSELKRNIGATLIKVKGLEPVEVPQNTAPVLANPIADLQTQLSEQGSAVVSLDLSQVFSDAEGDTLTLSATGVEGITLDGTQLEMNFTASGEYPIVISASDGELSTETQFTVTVTAAPIVPVEPPSESSGGGSLGYFTLLLLGLSGLRRRQR